MLTGKPFVTLRCDKGTGMILTCNNSYKVFNTVAIVGYFIVISKVQIFSFTMKGYSKLRSTHYGVGGDMWSAECILAKSLAGKPIMPRRTEVNQ
ncbi:hypothetical protein FRX31_017066 [Thalictrum thalictroides]|uniref:Uncharacterized protein n=1 Tax=Thalictrum thalictroides TaxID=46969 RepID=A0A7J6W8U3_THATH|nr:hypothetical protein FRX31_017066 [Thalictrum thalictroides]